MQLTIDLPNDAYKALQLEAKQRGESLDKLIVKYLSLAIFFSEDKPLLNRNKWPDGFIKKTAGSFSDDPLERQPQGKFENRSEL